MSEIRANTISNAAGTGPVTLTGQYASKAWVQYLQATPVISNSFNVSSVTDTSTGLFTMNFTSSMSSDAYSRHFMGNGSVSVGNDGARSATNINFKTVTVASNSVLDTATYGSVDGDLA